MLLNLYTRFQAGWWGVRERLAVERGAIATEYALLLVLIAVAIALTAGGLGTAIINKFKAACTALQDTC